MKLIRKTNLLKHGLIIFPAIIVGRFFGYIFQMYVARVLGPEDYGIFGSLFALFLVFTIPIETIQTIISRFTSEYKVKNEYTIISSLMISALKKLFKIGIMVFILITLISFPLTKFLKLYSPVPLIILGISIIFSFILPVIRGILQGLQKFYWLGFNLSFSPLIRVITAIVLIHLGFGINGVVFSFSLGYSLPLLICFIPLSFLFKEKNNKKALDVKKIYKYTPPIFIAMSTIILMQNIDLIFVKHFFSSEEAGFYTAASNIGKIIVFLGSGVATILFPKASELHSTGKLPVDTLKEGLCYIISLSILFIFSCALFNKFITILFFGSEYIYSAKLLPYFALSMSFLGISIVIFRYLMAIKDFKFLFPLVIFLLLEITAILLFHSNLKEILFILNISFFCTLINGILSLSRTRI